MNGALGHTDPRLRWQLWIVAFGFFMQTLDTTIVNTALPSMAASLGESPLRMHGVIVAYVLTVAVTLPVSGWLADRFGGRNVFLAAIVLFSFGSLCCACAGSLQQLEAARVVQGIGGAMMVPVGRLTVLKLVPRDQYLAAMAFVTLPGQIGPLLGPALGGVLVQYASWHWIFLINLPVGVVGAVATWRWLPNLTLPPKRFDFVGYALLGVAMAALTLALEGHHTPVALLALLAAGLATALLYLAHARGNAHALFSLKLFDSRVFSMGLLGGFYGRIGSAMLPFLVPMYLQLGLGFAPAHAGLMMVPLVLGNMGVKRLVVRVVNRFGYRCVLVGATLALAALVLLLPLAARLAMPWAIPAVLLVIGMVNGVRFSTMNNLTLKELPDELASSGNSLMSMTQQLTMSIGVTVAGLLLAAAAAGSGLQGGFAMVWLGVAIITALPALVFWQVPDASPAAR
ncbi:MFS transporter, DHA2 family, multidrug resistance protein [Pseudomonas sp. URIL14HWK12:I9]|nr:DHA2 family multidrug resistance protein-like MFS transporter [Pseudomonas sp. URIL14HWK12:I12]PVZ22860.1 DHA2 family multidrug resistance protein-like MFS transporter [Pseudomonas sp. URIL14HWK12:I10]PVZ37510.1 DHA2 family multidrug resistance protein-like MFS transporter [Pseudomonas sp. URIL14HWK12:I11]SNZ14959.1 MFS transporter, DHA2 family, multidrug resistance protein [Pseudomonas sp. URIL14HWK12:I9]